MVQIQSLLQTRIISLEPSFPGSRVCVCVCVCVVCVCVCVCRRADVQEACSRDVSAKILGLPDCVGSRFRVCPFWCRNVCQGGKEVQ